MRKEASVASVRTSAWCSLALAVAIGLGGCAAGPDNWIPAPAGGVPPLHESVDAYPEATVRLVATGSGSGSGDVRADAAVKVADTADRQRHGLMEVPELPPGTGMWFPFTAERTGGFWMFGTLVPLDIAFLDREGTILRVLAMEPCEGDASACPSYDPGVAYWHAVEFPAGWLARIGIDEGDRIELADLADDDRP